MIGAPNTQVQKYRVGIVQWSPETSASEEIADIFANYNIDGSLIKICGILAKLWFHWCSLIFTFNFCHSVNYLINDIAEARNHTPNPFCFFPTRWRMGRSPESGACSAAGLLGCVHCRYLSNHLPAASIIREDVPRGNAFPADIDVQGSSTSVSLTWIKATRRYM